METKTIRDKLDEIDLTLREFDQMMQEWDKRKADPLVVCSIGIVKFIALAGVVIENDAAYLLFINKCVKQGMLMAQEAEEDDGSSEYIH